MPRLRYAELAPEAAQSLTRLGHYINTATALEQSLLGFVYLRASQLNGCDFCVHMHMAELQKHNEPPSRIDAVAVWQASEAFTPKERAALEWTEAVTNVQQGHVPDASFLAIQEFFQGKDLADLTFAIAQINAWNRLGIAFRAEWNPHPKAEASKPKQEVSQNGEGEISAVGDDGGKVAED